VGFGLILIIGKYVFVGLIYLFVIAVFRVLVVRIAAGEGTPPPRRVPTRAAAAPRITRPRPPRPPAADTVQEPVAVAEAEVPTRAVQPARARLVVVSTSAGNLSSGLSFPLGKSVSIGRKSHNDITVQDRYVSATHALIISEEGDHILRDYHSTNGTLHNGSRMKADVVLRDGDEIGVGTTVFRYQG